MTWTLTFIPKDGLRHMWPIVAPLLAPAVAQSGGRIDMRSLFEWLSDGRTLLWVAYGPDKVVKAAFTTREAHYPRKSMLVLECCGGTGMDSWMDDADRVFRAYARDAGLDGIELYGRIGWGRKLKKLGWKPSLLLVETDVVAGG